MPDAVKKIILESEQGKFAKYGVIQNRKLRREVTTISRMTHKNIVRYYQAWVEGASGDTGSAIPEEEDDDDDQDNQVDSGNVLATDEGMNDDDEKDSSRGWWSDYPQDHDDIPTEMQSESSSTSSTSSSKASTVSWSDDGNPSSSLNGSTKAASENPSRYKRTDSSLSQLLQHENDQGFGVSQYLRFCSSGPRSASYAHKLDRFIESATLRLRFWRTNIQGLE